MANIAEIEIRLSKIEEAISKIDNLGKKLDETAKKGETAFTKMDVAIGSFLGSLAAGAARKGLSEIQEFFTTSIQSASEAEVAVNRLNISLKSTGIFSELASADLQKYAGEMQNITKYSDEATMESLSLLQSIARLDKEGLKRAQKAAADLASAFNVDLVTATEAVARSANGMNRGLQSIIGQKLPQGKTNAENFANALKMIEDRFGGTAQRELDTYSGKMANLANRFDDAKEGIGQAFQALITSLTPALEALIPVVNAAATALKALFRIKQTDFSGLEELEGKLQETGKKIADISYQIVQLEKAGIQEQVAVQKKWLADTQQYYEMLLDKKMKFKKEMEAGDLKPTSGGPSDEDNERQKKREQEEKEFQERMRQLRKEGQRLELEDQVQQEILLGELNTQNQDIRLQRMVEQYGKEEAIKIEAMERMIALEQNGHTKSIMQQELANKKAEAATRQRAETFKKITTDNTSATLSATANALNAFSQLAAAGGQKYFGITKALALATIPINTASAIVNALKLDPPLNWLQAAAIGAAGAAQLANATRQSPPAFEQGGLIPGNSFSGDKVNIRANSGERVLNMDQQEFLLKAAGSGDIVISINGREIARAVREQIKDGFAIV